jgi:flagellar biosynthesis protein FlhA
MATQTSKVGRLLRQGDLWLVFGIFSTILLLILPVPPVLLDLLLTVSIALSLLILLVILYVKEPADFSGFPTLLLFVTLFRLALNVASTRLILLDGYAGHIIEAFGNFVVRGNYVVGLVVFLILVLINFVVITKGAGRIAEVAARFTLDAMPGKQMAIDAELSAGVINEAEARSRRRKVEQEADFYGAMDGASKFVRGDAIAAVLITLVNVLGGFAIGILQKGMPVGEALQRFTLLSIGDGLVSQVPALIISTAAGMLVTRAAAKAELGQELSRQLLFYPRAMTILAVMLGVMALVPGLPMMPFAVLAVITGIVARQLKKRGITKPWRQPRTSLQHRPQVAQEKNSKRCSKWTRCRSSWVTASSPWPTRAKAATCSNASPRCGARSPLTWASSFRRSGCATICSSARTSIVSFSRATPWRAAN